MKTQQILKRIFFHLKFWTSTLIRIPGIILRNKKLIIGNTGLNKAFFIEGEMIVLSWEIENAWWIRVNHPGGLYHSSDSTWFACGKHPSPITIRIYRGFRPRILEIPVLAVPGPALKNREFLQAKPSIPANTRKPVLTAAGRSLLKKGIQFSFARNQSEDQDIHEAILGPLLRENALNPKVSFTRQNETTENGEPE